MPVFSRILSAGVLALAVSGCASKVDYSTPPPTEVKGGATVMDVALKPRAQGSTQRQGGAVVVELAPEEAPEILPFLSDLELPGLLSPATPEDVEAPVVQTKVSKAALPKPTTAPAPEQASDLVAEMPKLDVAVPARSKAEAAALCDTVPDTLPLRRPQLPGGLEVVSGWMNLAGPDRDKAFLDEVRIGNIPPFLHDLKPVVATGTVEEKPVEIVFCVTPDYLAVGSDEDYVRVPAGMPAAATLTARYDMSLPTEKMVDLIYAYADTKLSPAPKTPGAEMSTTAYFLEHDQALPHDAGRAGLLAGHKKDLIQAWRLRKQPDRVAIYGWHERNGVPVQPASLVHGATYADYSHGIRLVSRTAFLNGTEVGLSDILGDAELAWILTGAEGVLPNADTFIETLAMR